jgi:hypothetical protein
MMLSISCDVRVGNLLLAYMVLSLAPRTKTCKAIQEKSYYDLYRLLCDVLIHSKSGRKRWVKARRCSVRQRSMWAWLPDNSTAGTSCPRHTSGRV